MPEKKFELGPGNLFGGCKNSQTHSSLGEHRIASHRLWLLSLHIELNGAATLDATIFERFCCMDDPFVGFAAYCTLMLTYMSIGPFPLILFPLSAYNSVCRLMNW